MWLKHHRFLEVVKHSWSITIQGPALYVFAANLKRLKFDLIIWNKEIFGDIFLRVKQAEETLKVVKIMMEDDQSE